jgi:Fic family protein
MKKNTKSKKTPPSPLSSPSRGEDASESSPPLRGGDEGEGDFCGCNSKSNYSPPYTRTSRILQLVGEISEWIGSYAVTEQFSTAPDLRRGNRLRTIHASLAIENNTLTLSQVTAVIEGKRVIGPPREVQEVRNAFAAYENMDRWKPDSEADLFAAHGIMMAGLMDDAGRFRSGGVGVMAGDQVVHMAPTAGRVPQLISNLLTWLRQTDEHPLVSSSVFHYEFEFIHPFSDGNGRMVRLWQTLILSRWKPLFAFLPVETVIRNRQAEYYQALATSGSAGNSTVFVEFLMAAILEALKENSLTDQVTGQVTDQVKALLNIMADGRQHAASDLMKKLKLSHRQSFRKLYLHAALSLGWIEMTIPDKPNSRLQKYRLTEKGKAMINQQLS